MTQLSGVAAEFCARFYGGRFQSVPSSPTVGTSVSTIVQNNSERASLLIVNLSANSVTIYPGSDAALTRGIILTPNGGSFTTNLLEDLTLPSYQFTAIADGPASELLVVETLRFEKQTAGGNDNAG